MSIKMQQSITTLVCVIILVCIFYSASFVLSQSEPEYYLEQSLDHFDPLNEAKFQQRYFVFDKYRANDITSDTVLLYICGEAMCSGTPQNYAINYTKELQAQLVTVEHRYYGKSIPVPTLSTLNLKYLTTQQALADLAHFVEYYNEHAKLVKPKWIVIGCSYAGALSAWFRLKYPHLVVGALSSSGVVNAILDFWQFDDQVQLSTGKNCSKQLRRVTGIMEKLFHEGKAAHTKKTFLADHLDDGDFWFLVADAAAESIQYGFHDEVCNPMLKHEHSSDMTLLEVYAHFVREFFYKQFDTDAPNDYALEYVLDESVVPEKNARQWWYQTCVEVAFFQTWKNHTSIRSRSVDLNYHYNRCTKTFGKELLMPPNTEYTNLYYGGNHVDVTNVVYAQGSQDPWKRASVLQSQSESAPLIEIKCQNCGHCVDLRGCPSLPSGKGPSYKCQDEAQVERVRREILSHMKLWLQ